VKADLSKIYEPGTRINVDYKISYPGDVPSNAFVEESRSPLYLNVEYRRNKDVPVQVKWVGTRSEEHLYDTENAVLDYTTVNVIGPASAADLIKKAVIEVDLSERLESFSESYRYTLCDEEGNPVDAEEITTNLDEVRLDMKIQKIKEVKLVADVIYGGGASELNTAVTVYPETIRLSGSEAALAEIGDTITLCTVNLSEIDASTETTYTINLPEGVVNQTGLDEATVKVKFAGLSIREFVVENIQAINVPEGLDVELITAKLTVKVRGPSALLSKMTAEDILVTVDFTGAEVGSSTFKATIVFGEAFPTAGAMGTYSVSATVQTAEGT
jgi:YbbR domain-containing protein